MFTISIIIPVKNGAATLVKCLKAIEDQQYNGKIETIVLDSSSTDESVAIASNYGAKVIDISPEEFNHGLTRNVGVKSATGDLVYFTVQDAWLAGVDNLQKMADQFNDKEVQSVTGMQAIPHDLNKNPALWFKRSGEPIAEVYQYNEKQPFSRLPPIQQKQICCWDNVNTMYSKSALLEQPFVRTSLSEDMIWAKQALEKGWKIIRDPSLVVYHYHHHTFRYSFRLNYSVAYEDRKIFGIKPTYPTVIIPFLRRLNTIRKNKNISTPSKPVWIFYNAGMYAAHTLSVAIFRGTLFFGGEKLLDKSLRFFCNAIPQGKQK